MSLLHLESCLVRLLGGDESSPATSETLGMVARQTTEIRQALYTKVFADLTTEHAKQLISSGAGSADQGNFADQYSSGLIYGEVQFASMAIILQQCKPCKGNVFVDLGHGTGKALIAAAACYGDVLSRIHGIELLEPLFIESRSRLESYQQALQQVPSQADFFLMHRNCSLSVEHGDFLSPDTLDWTAADIVFVNSTCFDATLMKKIAQRAENMRSGSRLVTLTHPLPSDSFHIVWKENLCMSWGVATVHIHQRC